MRRATGMAIIMACGLAASAAAAQNIGFMRQGPVAYLTEAQQELLRAALRNALNDAGDGETVAWGGPEAGASGSLLVLDTHEDYGTTCRTLRSRMEAGGRSGGGDYRLCRADDGSWRFAPARRRAPDETR